MKKSILGAFIGLSIVTSIDSLARVIIALVVDQEILMFSYSGYPGMIWPITLVVVAGLSSFLGSLFSLSYGKLHKITSIFLFLILLTLLRYTQTYLLMGTEDIIYPIAGFVLSVLVIFPAWRIMTPRKKPDLFDEKLPPDRPKYHQPEEF